MILDDFSWTLQEAGPFLWIVVSCAFLSLFVIFGLAAAMGFKLRVPLPLWLLGPLTTALAGQIGMLYGQSMLQDALMWMDGSTNSMTWAGHAAALLTNIGGAYCASFVLLASVWTMGFMLAAVPGEEPRWTAGLAFVALLFPLTAACGTGVFAFATSAWGAPMVLLLGAPGLAMACLRETDTPRVHSGRMAAAALLVLAVGWAALGDVLRLERVLAEIWLGSWLETMEVLEGLVTSGEQNIHAAVLGGAVNVLAASALVLVTAIFGRQGLDWRGALGAAMAVGLLGVPLLLEIAIRWVAAGYLPVTW